MIQCWPRRVNHFFYEKRFRDLAAPALGDRICTRGQRLRVGALFKSGGSVGIFAPESS
jgi:hypothetical protein